MLVPARPSRANRANGSLEHVSIHGAALTEIHSLLAEPWRTRDPGWVSEAEHDLRVWVSDDVIATLELDADAVGAGAIAGRVDRVKPRALWNLRARARERMVERHIVMPSQATAYKIGMMKILELRSDAKEKLGDNFDIREFHDVVLTSGAVPLNVLEDLVNDWVEKK